MRARGTFEVAGWGRFQAIWENERLLLLEFTELGLPAYAVAETTVDDPFLAEVEAQVRAYLAGQLRRFQLPLGLLETPPFRAQLWAVCQEIPYGKVLSYADLAALAGRPRAARAAGSAMANAPISLVIPCHRVIGTGWRLGGFGGNLELKRRLLALEGVEVTEDDRVLPPGREAKSS